ncbi:MAG: hypothetical protein JKY37_07175 [Nannocystaceae bacterium]|nr:hypothetical protein [Nannocystaceae bacterium]
MALGIAGGSLGVASSATAAPKVFNTKHHQSPVRADPGDLLVLPGAGFQDGSEVVYLAVSNDVAPAVVPIPTSNTANMGMLEVVQPGSGEDSFNNAPDSMVVRLPTVMREHQTYALWVLAPDGTYSEPILINDPRPLWSSPGVAYKTLSIGSMDRKLRVVGRNLERTSRRYWTRPALVRLTGPTTSYLLWADAPDQDLEHYVVDASLPANLAVGEYEIEISVDWFNWHAVPENTLRVVDDTKPPVYFRVSDYSTATRACQPDDQESDTECIREAIADAAAFAVANPLSKGGVVWFKPGQWDLMDVDIAEIFGLVVPQRVHLEGESADNTLLARDQSWEPRTVFTLQGHTEVSNLHFHEVVGESGEPLLNADFFRLGHDADRVAENMAESIEMIVVHDNKFTDMFSAFGDGGLPVKDLFITDNEFRAYHTALYLHGTENPRAMFTLSDVVIADNYFEPGAYDPDDQPSQGTLATSMGASRRMDFSRNDSNGRVYGGWRAAYFWHMAGAHEMLLVSENTASCTSEKGGDGEFLSFDGNKDVRGFTRMAEVTAAGPTYVRVGTPWLTDDDYNDHWVVVVEGEGLGQARRIVSYTPNDEGPNPSMEVTPAWDVIPVIGDSKVIVTRGYWSMYSVANEVDNVSCGDANDQNKGGVIAWYGATFDSTVENNVQLRSSGIELASAYIVDSRDGASPHIGLVYASEIRSNIIEGEYNSKPGSLGGIRLWYGASRNAPSAITGYNVSVSHNSIFEANALGSGASWAAIIVRLSWHRSLESQEQYKATTIHNNYITGGNQIHLSGLDIYATTTFGNRDDTAAAIPVVSSTGPGLQPQKTLEW